MHSLTTGCQTLMAKDKHHGCLIFLTQSLLIEVNKPPGATNILGAAHPQFVFQNTFWIILYSSNEVDYLRTMQHVPIRCC